MMASVVQGRQGLLHGLADVVASAYVKDDAGHHADVSRSRCGPALALSLILMMSLSFRCQLIAIEGGVKLLRRCASRKTALACSSQAQATKD